MESLAPHDGRPIVLAVPCGHCFHEHCLNAWSEVQTAQNRWIPCPCCNQIVLGTNICFSFESDPNDNVSTNGGTDTGPAIMEEAFFVPCTRMHDLIRAWNVVRRLGDDDFLFPEDFEEVEVRDGAEDGAVDFLHNTDFMFDKLWRLAGHKIVWMDPEILLLAGRADGNIGEVCEHFGFSRHLFSFGVGERRGKRMTSVFPFRTVTDATSTTVCNYVFQLMTWSNTLWTHLRIIALPSVSTDTLSRFLKNTRSSTGGTISFEADFLSTLSRDQLRRYLRVFEDSTGPHHQIKYAIGSIKSRQVHYYFLSIDRVHRARLIFCHPFPDIFENPENDPLENDRGVYTGKSSPALYLQLGNGLES
jgi:hypothetical protein